MPLDKMHRIFRTSCPIATNLKAEITSLTNTRSPGPVGGVPSPASILKIPNSLPVPAHASLGGPTVIEAIPVIEATPVRVLQAILFHPQHQKQRW